MSLLYSAIVPHSPLLIPTVGKENLERLRLTIDSYKKIEEDLYSCSLDTIVILSPHGPIQPNAFTMNLNPEFVGNFEEFGDFSTKIKLAGDIGLAYRIRERMETRAPLQLISDGDLDYGCSVPLFLLTRMMPKVKIIPIYYSGLDLNAHFQFGELLKREFLVNQNRIAVIASGDLSHKLSKDSPAGYSARGKKFDKKIISYLTSDKIQEILKIDHHLIYEAGECALRSIAILLGIIDGINHRSQLLSYESPFGIGYLTMKFELR